VDEGFENHHEKFLDFVFDSLATMESTRLLLADAMEQQNIQTSKICPVIELNVADMESRYQELFDYNEELSLQRILDESAFNTWQTRLYYTYKEEGDSHYHYNEAKAHDDYRGSNNGYDSYTCNYCQYYSSSGYYDMHCNIEVDSNSTEVEPYPGWTGYPEVLCDHCLDYVANQQATRKNQISDAGINLQNIINSMKEIGKRHGCLGCFEHGVDYTGFDLDGQYVITNTAEDCQKGCQNTAECNFWTWDPSPPTLPEAACWLKSAKGETHIVERLTSGPKYCTTKSL